MTWRPYILALTFLCGLALGAVGIASCFVN